MSIRRIGGRRRREPTDDRPKWNDPNLPCVRQYKMLSGAIQTDIDPDYEKKYRDHMMKFSLALPFFADPTYNLRKK